MSYDELELDKLGDEKSALFFLISDTDTTYNFLVALAFSQMFNLLCERADNTYGGRLPYHVRVLWDEAANTGQVPGLEKIVAVIRSREISLTLFYQAMSQCKALYKDHSETIMGNIYILSSGITMGVVPPDFYILVNTAAHRRVSPCPFYFSITPMTFTS